MAYPSPMPSESEYADSEEAPTRKTKAQKLADIHEDALERFNAIQEVMFDVRQECLADRRFCMVPGAQWEGDFGAQFANRPKMEANKIRMSVIRIMSEMRNNPVTVNFVNHDGSETDLAELCDSLLRADEQDSSAQEAYTTAAEEAVTGGFGAYRLRCEYENEESEDEYQRIRFEPIPDADKNVWFDLGAKKQDKSDAKCAFILQPYSREDYEDEFDDDPTSWPQLIGQTFFDWYAEDVVYVAEYYEVEILKDTVTVWQWLPAVDSIEKLPEQKYLASRLKEFPEIEKDLVSKGYQKIREKKVKSRKVHKYLLSGGGILEDCGYIAGKYIPIVPIYGQRFFIDNKEWSMGQVRPAKDLQRISNAQLTTLTEMAALFKTQKPIFLDEQIVGHEQEWAEANINDMPFLTVNPIKNLAGDTMPAGPVGYTKPPEIAPATVALLSLVQTGMQEILGGANQADKIISNVSAETVESIHASLDMQTFMYHSNNAMGRAYGGKIWLSMAQETYTEPGRKMKAIGPQGEVNSIELMAKKVMGGVIAASNDLTEASFDVVPIVGPASATKKAATVRNLVGMLQGVDDPESKSVLQATAILNSEGVGLNDVQEFFRKKMLKMGIGQPTDKDKADAEAMAQANNVPDAQQEYLKAAADQASAAANKDRVSMMETMANVEKIQAQTKLTLADVQKTKAQVLEMLAKVGAQFEAVQAEAASLEPMPEPMPMPVQQQMPPMDQSMTPPMDMGIQPPAQADQGAPPPAIADLLSGQNGPVGA